MFQVWGARSHLSFRRRLPPQVLTAVARILDGETDPRTAVEEIMKLPQIPEV